MAVRTDASGEALSRTASLPDDESFTACGWAMLSADRNDYSTVFSLDDASSRYFLIETDSDGTTLALVDNTQVGALTAVNVNEWFFWALWASALGTGGAYVWRSSTGGWSSKTSNRTGFTMTPTGMFIGNNGFGEWMNGRSAAVKVWSGAALSQAEIEQERLSYLPQRWANIYGFWPLLAHGDLVDYSSNARPLTATGTLSTEDGPPIAWRRGRSRFRRPSAAPAGAIAGTADLLFGAGASTLAGAGALAGTAAEVFGTGSSSLTGAGGVTGAAAIVFGEGSSTLTGTSTDTLALRIAALQQAKRRRSSIYRR